MKKLLFGLFLICSTAIAADNSIVIEDFTIAAGEEKDVDVIMNNDVTFTAFQFEVELPEGVSVKYDEDEEAYCVGRTGRLLNAHNIVSQYQSSGTFKVMVYHNSNKNLKGNSGDPILTLTLVASDQVATGTYNMEISNIEMTAYDTSTQTATKYKPENTNFDCTLQVKTRVTTLGYASFSWPKAIDFSESGLTAFIAKNCTGSSLKLVPVTKVPANTGLILKGIAGSDNIYQLQTTEEETDDVSENILSSNTDGIYTVASDDIYVLSNLNDGQPGFYRAEQGIHVGQYKSYLQYSSSQSIELYFDEEETTGISIISNSQPTADDMYYDLQGRRVSHPTTGVYILNGKKIIVK